MHAFASCFAQMIVYAVVDDSLTRHLLGDSIEVFVRREDAERFIEEIRGDDPELARPLRIEERELDTGGVNWTRVRARRSGERASASRSSSRRLMALQQALASAKVSREAGRGRHRLGAFSVALWISPWTIPVRFGARRRQTAAAAD
jgi:hypothetical protein